MADKDDPTKCSLKSQLSGPASSKMILKGSGFGMNNCQNIVMIGNSQCTVTASSDTEIQCILSDSSKLEVCFN